MSYSSKSPSLNKILILVFGIAFGLVALMMVYQGVKTNMDTRSRAAQETVEYKAWNFTNDAEGWTGTNVASLNVSGGILYAVVGPGSILNSPTGTISLPQGNKYIKIRMAAAAGNSVLGDQSDCSMSSTGKVICPASPDSAHQNGSPGFVPGTAPVGDNFVTKGDIIGNPIPTGPQPCVPEPTCAPGNKCIRPMYYPQGGWCPTDTTPNPTNPSEKRYITISIHYAGELLDAGLTASIPVDASMNDYTLQFPEVNGLSLNQLSIHVDSGAVRPDTLLFDSIRVVGPVVSGGTTACSQEAKVCPDGSTVGRVGPNCEFAVCGQTIQPQSDQQQNVQFQNTNSGSTKPQYIIQRKLCTQEAKVCPDGSTVGRVGPNCEFAACGTGSANPTPTSIVPPSTLTWDACINMPGSVILQTNPQICRTQDGREVTEPTTSTPAPFIEWVSSVGNFFRGLFGFGQ